MAPLLSAVGLGALAKPLINSMLGAQVSLLAEWIGTLQRQGADAERILAVAATTVVWSLIAGRMAAQMLVGDFQPQFPVELIAKDFSYVLQLGSPAVQPVASAVHGVFKQAARDGQGAKNITAVVQLFNALQFN